MKKLILLMGLGAMFLTGCNSAEIKKNIEKNVVKRIVKFGETQIEKVDYIEIKMVDGRSYRKFTGDKMLYHIDADRNMIEADALYWQSKMMEIGVEYIMTAK